MKRALLTLFLYPVILAAGGCRPSQPPIARLGPDSVVLAFGDSLTSGVEADRKTGYPAILQGLLGCKVINAGVPGEVSSQGLKRLPLELDKSDPQLVILCHGGNDLLSKSDEAGVARNVEVMVDCIRKRGIDVVLVGVPRPALRLKSAPFYAEIAERRRIPCDAKTIADVLSHPMLKADQIHPNAEGNRKLAEALAGLINKSQSK